MVLLCSHHLALLPLLTVLTILNVTARPPPRLAVTSRGSHWWGLQSLLSLLQSFTGGNDKYISDDISPHSSHSILFIKKYYYHKNQNYRLSMLCLVKTLPGSSV